MFVNGHWLFGPGDWEQLIQTETVHCLSSIPRKPVIGDVAKMKQPTFLFWSLLKTFLDRTIALDCLADGLDHMVVNGVGLRRHGRVEVFLDKVMVMQEITIEAEPEFEIPIFVDVENERSQRLAA